MDLIQSIVIIKKPNPTPLCNGYAGIPCRSRTRINWSLKENEAMALSKPLFQLIKRSICRLIVNNDAFERCAGLMCSQMQD